MVAKWRSKAPIKIDIKKNMKALINIPMEQKPKIPWIISRLLFL